jgi:hypothetical protein
MDALTIAVIAPALFFLWGEQDLLSLLAIAASYNIIIGFLGPLEHAYQYQVIKNQNDVFVRNNSIIMAVIHMLAAFFILGVYWTGATTALPDNNGADIWTMQALFILTITFVTMNLVLRPLATQFGMTFTPVMNEMLSHGWMMAVLVVSFGLFMNMASNGATYSQTWTLYA